MFASDGGGRPLDVGGTVMALLDQGGAIRSWTPEATRRLGYAADEMAGRPLDDLLHEPCDWRRVRGVAHAAGDRERAEGPASRAPAPASPASPASPDSPAAPASEPPEGPASRVGPAPPGAAAPPAAPAIHVALRPRGGGTLAATLYALAGAPRPDAEEAEGPGYLLLSAAPAPGDSQDAALMRSVLKQSRMGFAVFGPDLRVLQANEVFADVVGARPADIFMAADAGAVEERLREVLATGEPLINWEHQMRRRGRPGPERVWALSVFRLLGTDDRPLGVAIAATDITVQHRARRRLDLLHRASEDIGVSLDVTRTAEALAGIFVPGYAGWAAVDLPVEVFEGGPLPALSGPWPAHQRQAAVAATEEMSTIDYAARTAALSSIPPMERALRLRQGHALLGTEMAEQTRGEGFTARFLRTIFPAGTHSTILVPLHTRDGMLGVVSMARGAESAPFDEEDVALVEETLSRATLNLDNAWRFAREHRTAVALQHSLLPRSFTRMTAAVSAGTYLSADAEHGVGGDWYDIIALSSLRCAFVVGDVVGHGLGATTTMGRMRTAVQTLADSDLEPSELLTRLDDLVLRLSDDRPPLDAVGGDRPLPDAERGDREPVGATCLYGVYDPVTSRISIASAGHPPPLLVDPRGKARFLDLDPGPPLGVGGMPFETTEVELAAGTTLAFYTDGLVEQRRFDLQEGMSRLRRVVERKCRPDAELQSVSSEIARELLPDRPDDDAALLLARTRILSPDDTVHWSFPARIEVVAEARSRVTRTLSEWRLDDLAFTTEIIVSELVTNAIRHAGGPVGLRLLRDESVLVCEVSDPSSTQPRLRRARFADEGGRGLFIVAQVAQRWGSRYTYSGKTIWAEQRTVPHPTA